MIYLDNNATTPLDPAVADAMLEVMLSGPCNASSQHTAGQRARQRMDEAIERIGAALGTRLHEPGSARWIVTSGGTEANNLALRGLRGGTGPLIVSQIEHPSVLAVAEILQQAGRRVRYLPVTPAGIVRVDVLADWLRDAEPATVVSVMSANNETGVLQPIEAISALCREAAVGLHVDASQSIAKVPLPSLDLWGAAAVTISPHKFHGPVGVGGLWLAAGEKLEPQLWGGQQQLGTRPGTEPVALVVGMQEAVQIGLSQLTGALPRIAAQRDRLEQTLLAEFPEWVVHGGDAERLPNTSCLSLIGSDRQSMLMALDLAGVACSSGSACTSGSSPPSHVLTAMNVSMEGLGSAIRFGVSRMTEDREIERAVDIISHCYKRLRR